MKISPASSIALNQEVKKSDDFQVLGEKLSAVFVPCACISIEFAGSFPARSLGWLLHGVLFSPSLTFKGRIIQ